MSAHTTYHITRRDARKYIRQRLTNGPKLSNDILERILDVLGDEYLRNYRIVEDFVGDTWSYKQGEDANV